MLSCDGSFAEEFSGWGFTVAKFTAPLLLDFCGPTVLDTLSPSFIGAAHHSNNVGELSALYYALKWIAFHTSAGDQLVLEYDSEYAAQTIQRTYRARSNLSLILNACAAYDLVASRIAWRKIEAHAGLFLNERADQLAKCGARGITRGAADIQRWHPARPD